MQRRKKKTSVLPVGDWLPWKWRSEPRQHRLAAASLCYLGDRFTNCAKRALKTRHVWGLCYTLLNAGHGYSVLSPRAPAGLCWAGLPRARCSRSLCLGLPPRTPCAACSGTRPPARRRRLSWCARFRGGPVLQRLPVAKQQNIIIFLGWQL